MQSNCFWTEKYKPNNLNEIRSQHTIIELLNKFIEHKNMPHMIFYGMPGVGKTATIMAFAKNIYGANYKDNILEFTASNDRGIKSIRNKIKSISKEITNNCNNIPWKIILLDDADNITLDSQFALRRIIEQYSKTTRFCIICNNINTIIDPIVSRCSLFIFNNINKQESVSYLLNICKKENIAYDLEIIDLISDISKGDLRFAINILEFCYKHNSTNIIDKKFIYYLSGIISESLSTKIFNELYNKNFNKYLYYVRCIYKKGYSIINQIDTFMNYILNFDIPDDKKFLLVKKICEIEQNIINVHNEQLQYLYFFIYMYIIIYDLCIIKR